MVSPPNCPNHIVYGRFCLHLSDLGSVIASRIKQEEMVMHCKVMGFCTPLLQEAAYELWLKSQKRALHLKCASYLEWQAHRCKCCGEGDFISFHRHAAEGMLYNIDSQELRSEPANENVLSEAASIIVSETLKKLEQPGHEGKLICTGALIILVQQLILHTSAMGSSYHWERLCYCIRHQAQV